MQTWLLPIPTLKRKSLTDRPVVLIVGVTGLFGGLLARRLVAENRFTVVGAGRTRESLDAFSTETGVSVVVVDRENTNEFKTKLLSLEPFAVVDCAGPFQYYGDNPYKFAQMVIKAGCHYVDIADATDFVVGFSQLDNLAQENAVSAVSGVSSTPAISSAVTDELSRLLKKVVSIETAIIPGNRTRRTLSVMQAIIGQVGQPFLLTSGGNEVTAYGWSDTRRISLGLPAEMPVKNRLASLVNTPDGKLFPQRYQAQTVALRAGLEIKLFHRVLQVLGWLVRLRIVRSLVGLSPLARRVASWFENAGSDIGGMQVVVIGQDHNNDWRHCTWELVASDGQGPEIPTLPVSVLLEKLHKGLVAPGARAAPGEVSLIDLNPRFNSINAETRIDNRVVQPVFKSVLGTSFSQLPLAVQELHNHIGTVRYEGVANSKGPTGVTGRIAAWLFGFPGQAAKVPVTVTLSAKSGSEHWIRQFAGATFHSTLSQDKDGRMQERFGPVTMQLGLHVSDERLYFPVHSAKLFGVIPLPHWALPKSMASESVDAKGRFRFDVELYTPFGARIAHYTGWLVQKEN